MAIEAALETGLWKGVELLDPEKGRVSRDLFVDEELYAIEKARVNTRSWLFVGFEDQVRKPGDYFVSRMGEESVILSRDRDNTVHVFLNSCRHRGMKVCRYDEGNTPVFTCPYHGWSYAGDGSLVGVPRYKDAYREELDKSQWDLVEVARMENYKGTVWATWDPSTPSFYEYIGDLEPILGQAIAKPDGSEADIEVVRGVQKWILPSNWKFGHENFLTDGYHGIPTHRSVDLLTLSPSGQQGRHTHDHVTRESYWFTIAHHGSGRLTFRVNKETLPYTPTYPKAPAVEAYFRDAYERRPKQLGKIARLPTPAEPGGASVFPSTTMGNRVAVWNPNGPDQTEVWRWYTIYRDAPQEAKDLTRHYDISYAGPAGLTEQDDMENWNYAHPASKGVIARRYPYAYVQGVGLEKQGDPVLEEFGLVPNGTVTRLGEGSRRAPPSEQNARGAYRFWMQLMQAKSWDELRVKGLWP